MNYNFTLQCDTCEEKTNVRVGMSNRDLQPLRFACQTCGSPIDITMDKGFTFNGAHTVEGKQPFDAETNFVDLHLDFPVSFAPYVMGRTPFMMAFKRIGHKNFAIHNGRLNWLNANGDSVGKFATVLKLYANEKTTPFRMNAEKTFGVKLRSEKPEDVNLALYEVIAKMMIPFADPEEAKATFELYMQTLQTMAINHRPALDAFLDDILDSKFLKNAQLDALEVYPRMWKAELALRPALFLDFDEDYKDNRIAMRVSADQFETYKDLFKDISEIISRMLVLVGGINNILKRNDHNSFLPVISNAGNDQHPATLHKYADVELGRKHNFIDDPWLEMIEGPLDNQLRNAIAHYKAEYDDVTQTVTYFPRKEGIKQDKSETVSFLEFMRQLLVAYRDMNRFHQLVKALFFFQYLIRAKAAPATPAV